MVQHLSRGAGAYTIPGNGATQYTTVRCKTGIKTIFLLQRHGKLYKSNNLTLMQYLKIIKIKDLKMIPKIGSENYGAFDSSVQKVLWAPPPYYSTTGGLP